MGLRSRLEVVVGLEWRVYDQVVVRGCGAGLARVSGSRFWVPQIIGLKVPAHRPPARSPGLEAHSWQS